MRHLVYSIITTQARKAGERIGTLSQFLIFGKEIKQAAGFFVPLSSGSVWIVSLFCMMLSKTLSRDRANVCFRMKSGITDLASLAEDSIDLFAATDLDARQALVAYGHVEHKK